MQPVCIRTLASLVTIVDVHHLDEGGAVDGLSPILHNRQVHGGVRLLELLLGVLALQHVHFDVVVVEVADLAVKGEGAGVRVQKEADHVDFIQAAARNNSRSNVSLVLAQCVSHLFLL